MQIMLSEIKGVNVITWTCINGHVALTMCVTNVSDAADKQNINPPVLYAGVVRVRVCVWVCACACVYLYLFVSFVSASDDLSRPGQYALTLQGGILSKDNGNGRRTQQHAPSTFRDAFDAIAWCT